MKSVYQERLAQAAKLRQTVYKLRDAGKLLREISARVGVSKQRVHQILQERS